jgi:excisionase family DNA binding protein
MQQPKAEPLTYTVDELPALLGISRGLAYEAVRTGQIPSIRVGKRRILIPRRAIRELLGEAGETAAA